MEHEDETLESITNLSKNVLFKPLLILIYILYYSFTYEHKYSFDLTLDDIKIRRLKKETKVVLYLPSDSNSVQSCIKTESEVMKLELKTFFVPVIVNTSKAKIRNRKHYSERKVNLLVKDIKNVLNLFGRDDVYLQKLKELHHPNIHIKNIINFFPHKDDKSLCKIKDYIISIYDFIVSFE
jgi:hypothetical protein